MTGTHGWDELLLLVRRCDSGERLNKHDRRLALELATSVGLASLPGLVGASISEQLPDGGFVTPAAAGRDAFELDRVQYGADDGPCLSAARNRRSEQIDSMTDDERWPQLSSSAAQRGITSSLSTPLLTAAFPAALNLYAGSGAAFGSPRTQALVGVLARATSALMADPDAAPADRLSSPRLQRALAERAVIARAQGVMMAREGLNAKLAYRRLAIRSGRAAIPLRDVAHRLLVAEEAASGYETASGQDVPV